MRESFIITEFINASPLALYTAWLNSEQHSAMTGGEAQCSDQEGAPFTAWDGYIWGKNIQLIPGKKIVQSWRTSEFEESDEDSLLTIELESTKEGTKMTLRHANIPERQTQYLKGWEDHYFIPMKNHFR